SGKASTRLFTASARKSSCWTVSRAMPRGSHRPLRFGAFAMSSLKFMAPPGATWPSPLIAASGGGGGLPPPPPPPPEGDGDGCGAIVPVARLWVSPDVASTAAGVPGLVAGTKPRPPCPPPPPEQPRSVETTAKRVTFPTMLALTLFPLVLTHKESARRSGKR